MTNLPDSHGIFVMLLTVVALYLFTARPVCRWRRPRSRF